MSETQTEGTAAETELNRAVTALVSENASKLLPTLVRALEENGVRCLVAAVGLLDEPQVQMTLTVDDVTRETVTKVVKPVLRRAGFPADVVPVMAGAAGSAVSRALAAQRAKRDQEQARVAAARSAASQSQSQPSGMPGPEARPAWRPGPRR